MVNFEMKGIQALPKGFFGTMDGGASCMVLGHDTLMNYIEHFHKEIDVSCFKFRPATKAMQFGGDRTMEAQWTVHMPVCVQGRLGRAEAFVALGSTPLLIGRPILKAMKIQLNFVEDTMSVDESPWKKIVTWLGVNPRRLIRVRLHDGGDLFQAMTQHNSTATTETYTLEHYLELTGLPPPNLETGEPAEPRG